MKTERVLEIILAAVACFCAANSVLVFLNSGGVIPTEYFKPATIFGWGWLFFLWAEPKRLS